MLDIVVVEAKLIGADASWRTKISCAEIRAHRVDIRSLAMLAGDIEAEPVVPLIADAETDSVGISYVVLPDLPALRPDKVWI